MRFKKRTEADKVRRGAAPPISSELGDRGEGRSPVGTGDAAASAGARSAQPGAQPRIAGRFAYDGLERLLHERARLSILSSLSAHPAGLLFNDLKSLCALTDGNLSRQLQTLQDAGLIEMWKSHRGSRPQTLCRLTPTGQERFLEYVNVLEGVVADALARSAAPAPRAESPGAARPAANA